MNEIEYLRKSVERMSKILLLNAITVGLLATAILIDMILR